MTRLKNGFFVTFIQLFVLYSELIHSVRCHDDLKEHKNWPLLDRGTLCGRRLRSQRILGGKKADHKKLPWLVNPLVLSIVPQADSSASDELMAQSCGGSVINERYVLTAAHCCEQFFKNATSTTYYVQQNGDKDAHPEILFVDNVTIHERYSPDKLQNDICLMRLNTKLRFTDNFQPICLPKEPYWEYVELSELSMTVAGWGLVYNESTLDFQFPDSLQEVDVTVIPGKSCVQQWREKSASMEVNPLSQLCAGTSDKDACQGDSGGPLMYRDTVHGPKRYFLIGLVSFGASCKLFKTRQPGVYVRVSYYMPWILDNIYE